MNNIVAVRFDSDSLSYPRVKDVILSGNCRRILPASLMNYRKKGKPVFVYNKEGYKVLSSYREMAVAETLGTLEEILDMIKDCKNFFLVTGEYLLSLDCIYISEDKKKTKDYMKLAYIPRKKGEEERNPLNTLIHQMRKITTENGRSYLERLCEYMERGSYTPEKLKMYIEELKREIYMLDIV